MLQSSYISPSTIGLITTNKCTAACKDCCFGCNQNNKSEMRDELIHKVISQTVNVFPTTKLIVLTGGECFLLGDRLFSTIQFITNNGLKSRVITNAFWATSFKRAYSILSRLKQSGLSELNISTGDEHLKWIPYDNIINVIVACVKTSIPITVNVESSDTKVFTASKILCDRRIAKYLTMPDAITIVNGHWVSSDNKDHNQEKEKHHIISDNLRRCTSLFSSPSVTPEGLVIGCCGLTSQSHPHLSLGNINHKSMDLVYRDSFDDFLKVWIFTEGPYSILRFCQSKNKKIPPVSQGLHICEYCKIIYTNKECFFTLKKHCKEMIPTIITKYTLLRSRYKNH